MSPEVRDLIALILKVLEAHPEARQAVADALRQGADGGRWGDGFSVQML